MCDELITVWVEFATIIEETQYSHSKLEALMDFFWEFDGFFRELKTLIEMMRDKIFLSISNIYISLTSREDCKWILVSPSIPSWFLTFQTCFQSGSLLPNMESI